MELTGDDKIVNKLKNKRVDTIEKKTSSDHRLKIIEHFETFRINMNITNNTFRNVNRIVDQLKKKIKTFNKHTRNGWTATRPRFLTGQTQAIALFLSDPLLLAVFDERSSVYSIPCFVWNYANYIWHNIFALEGAAKAQDATAEGVPDETAGESATEAW